VHFVLLLLQLLLDRLIPTWRDGLTMAARADGRIEHIPTRPGWWDRCLSWLSGEVEPAKPRRRKVRAVRGSGEALRPDSSTGPPVAAPDVS
jgi:hypothetical protein